MFLVCLLFLICSVSAELGCKNEDGDSIDWYALYKLPKNSKVKSPLEKAGEAHVVLDVVKGTWVASSKSVEDPECYLGNTFNQVIKKQKTIAYLIYNDQLPVNDSNSDYWGHTKGVLATDGKTGFWLVHSVPKFPSTPDSHDYDYPENGKENGQNILCITFKFDQLETIVGLFRFTRPQIYSKNSIKAISSLPAELQKFFTGHGTYVTKPPFNTTVTVKSKGGVPFTVFAKHSKWGKDLYDGLVAPSLSASLYVQSWQVGAGTPLDSDCKDPYYVYNVDAMSLNYTARVPSNFSTSNDHSKWAASQNADPPWACIGDINRMESQFKRGGGTVCVKSVKAWKAYTSIITRADICPGNHVSKPSN